MRCSLQAISGRLPMYLLLGVLLLAAVSLQAAAPEKQLVIRVPEGIDTEGLTVLARLYPSSSVDVLRKSPSGEYRENLSDQTTSVKLLIHHPLYKVIAVTLDPEAASKPYAPEFVKATMVPVMLRVVDTKGKPFADQPLCVTVELASQEYFGRRDGIYPIVRPGKLNGVTNADGECSILVPSILDDPYFQSQGIRSFGIRLDGPGGYKGASYDVLLPLPIPARRSYTEPVIVTIRYRGMIRGRVGKSFLESHGVADKDRWVWMMKHGERSAGGIGIGPDGSFEMAVSAGLYDLTIESWNGKKLHSVTALRDVVVGEKETRVVTIK